MINSLTMPIRLMSCWGSPCHGLRRLWKAIVKNGLICISQLSARVCENRREDGSINNAKHHADQANWLASTETDSRSVARDDDHPEILVELNVVLASLHFASSTS